MGTLVEIGRPIFLHFLDRETATSVEEQRPETVDISTIETLTICHYGGLSINLHPLALYSASKPTLLEYALGLNKFGVLINTSHDSNIGVHIAIRQNMYSGIPGTVPIYFRDSDKLARFSIHKINSYSTTLLIRKDIFGYDTNHTASFAPRAKWVDKALFAKNLDTIQGVISRHEYAAITADNIAHFANASELSPESIDAIRRVLAGLYQDHYSANNRAITATGVPKLASLSDDYTYFPHYDIPVLQGLLRMLEWYVLAKKVAGLREHLLGAYASPEHCAFVESLHAFLYACSAQAMSALNITAVTADFAPAARSMILRIASIALLHAKDLRFLELKDILSFYRTAEELLIAAATFGAATWSSFKSAWESSAVAQDYVPPTGYPNLDQRLIEIRDELRLGAPLAERQIRDVLTLLAPLANLAQQTADGNKFETELSESEFQKRIKYDLRSNPQIGSELVEHPYLGRGIADLFFRGIPIELKSQSTRLLKLEDCRQFIGQILSYCVASGARIGILCVLDCSKKVLAPVPVEDEIGVLISQRSRTPMFVITVLLQGNLARPSDLA